MPIITRRMLLWLLLWITIVIVGLNSVTAEIVFNVTSVNSQKTIQTITPFQSDPVAINEPAIWTIPEIEVGNCTIKQWDDISKHTHFKTLKGTIVSFDKRSIWDAGCKSYYQLTGPDDTYCGGGRDSNFTASHSDILEVGSQSLNNASDACHSPVYKNINEEMIAVEMIEALEMWYNEQLDSDVVHTLQATISVEPGPWNRYFVGHNYEIKQYLVFISSIILFMMGIYIIYQLLKTYLTFRYIRILIIVIDLVSLCLNKALYFEHIVYNRRLVLFNASQLVLAIAVIIILMLWTMRMPYTTQLASWIFSGFLILNLCYVIGMLMWLITSTDLFMAQLPKTKLANVISQIYMQSVVISLYWVISLCFPLLLQQTVEYPSGRFYIYLIFDIIEFVTHSSIIIGISRQTVITNRKPRPASSIYSYSDLWYNARYTEDQDEQATTSNLKRSKTIMTHASRKTTLVI
ncbi:hypothetical protein BDF22DRAFT_676425 [Syncephalis plumigaleata]|nr:hypothetical protein BDF22DRAFT_676425 [Syncephalis plumigaleata]